MTDILTLPDARTALGLPTADTSKDADLTATYIPAVTAIIEDVAGPVVARTGLTWIADGGAQSILLPSAVTAVTAVTETGTTLTPNVDYTVNLRSGIVTRGSVQQPYIFLGGQSNIVITYSAGTAATPADVPANIKLAARLTLAWLWQSDQQGYRPAFGQPDTDTVKTPSGMEMPKRAWRSLTGRKMPGFA